MGYGMYCSTEVGVEISIIVPVLNEELLIAQTLAATRQTIGDVELIVEECGSSAWYDAGGDVCAAHA
jgi:hypothetical protein